ncbi:hypothetical protein RHODOSMS8_02907 [Rhodobiaceae bacterium]|nr:hypothetical protein RHODOSMS8_02907 [Rhodobiaceae bacterium]
MDRSPTSVKPASLVIVGNGYQAGRGVPQTEVSWHRRELDVILNLYGRKVAAGEWRDYAIDALRDKAVFSVFRRSSEIPLYRIEKHPKLTRKQGAYQVIAATGAILKRGHDLAQVIRVLDKKKLRLVD